MNTNEVETAIRNLAKARVVQPIPGPALLPRTTVVPAPAIADEAPPASAALQAEVAGATASEEARRAVERERAAALAAARAAAPAGMD